MSRKSFYLPHKPILRRSVSFVAALLIFFVPRISLPQVPNSTTLLDDQGINIGEIIAQGKYRHVPVKLEQMPQFFQDALIAIEDQRFYSHRGIDLRSLARATKANLAAGKVVQGGSTIPAQLVRNGYWLNAPRSVWRKGGEFVGAMLFEMRYSKQQILESYINLLNFGYMTYGPQSAAQYYFGRPLDQLTRGEMIALLTLPKNPNKYNPYKHPEEFLTRYKLLITTLTQKKIFSDKEAQLILSTPLSWKVQTNTALPYIQETIANNSVTAFHSPQSGYLQTTIDAEMTKKVRDMAYTTIKHLQRKNVSDMSVLIVDRQTHEIKVLLGGLSYANTGGQVNGVFAFNQPGSSIKPFTYVLAFQNLGWTPQTTILDLPVQYPTKEGYTYTPQNFSLTFKGPVTVGQALAESLNVPAVKTAAELGADKLLNFLREDVQIQSLSKDADHYGLALTLGDGDLSLYELTRAYGIFANAGQLCNLKIFAGQKTSCKQIIDSKYTQMIEDILSNRELRFPSFPMYSNLDFENVFVVLKSGTSRKFSDNWVMGYTDHYLIGIWVGNKDGSPMKGVTGASGAGDLFKSIVEYLEENNSRDALHASLEKNKASSQPYLQITNPLNQSIYTISDIIPLQKQQIPLQFSTNTDYDHAERTVDKKIISTPTRQLQAGNHTITLRLFAQGKEVSSDTVTIQVRE